MKPGCRLIQRDTAPNVDRRAVLLVEVSRERLIVELQAADALNHRDAGNMPAGKDAMYDARQPQVGSYILRHQVLVQREPVQ